MPNTEFELPVKNKEELDPQSTILISKLKYKIAIWTAVFSFLGLLVTSIIPIIDKVLTSKDKIIMGKAREQQAVQKILDSIGEERKKKQLDRAYQNINKIYTQLEVMRRSLPNSASISIYSTHDSGGVPQSGVPLNISVLYQANNTTPLGTKDYWQKRRITQGYFNLANIMYEKGFIYIPSLTNFPEIYEGETKEDLDFTNTKALYGRLIKVESKAVYYLVVSYEIENPVLADPDLFALTRVFANRFETLITSREE